MAPIVARLQRQGLPVRTVDVDQNPELARRFGVQNIPAFVLLVNGREVSRRIGATSEATLREMALRALQAEKQRQPAEQTRSTENTDLRNELFRSRPQSNSEQASAEAASGRSVPSRPVGIASQDAAPLATSPSPVEEGRNEESHENRLFQRPRRVLPFLFRKTRAREADGGPPVVRAKYEVSNRRPSRNRLADPDLSCCVRIRVRDEGGINFGSGTIIASVPGRSIILTCGHVFRDLPQGAQIRVDVFHGDDIETFTGRLIGYDLEADVGLLSVPSLLQLPVAPVAPEGYRSNKGDRVVSLGCSGGEPPTRQVLQITALNRYLGPDNIECTGVPVQGRSGGGLFNERGEVIGVCIAADPRDQRGLYAGLGPVHAILERAGLSQLFRQRAQPSNSPASVAETTPPVPRGEERPVAASPARVTPMADGPTAESPALPRSLPQSPSHTQAASGDPIAARPVPVTGRLAESDRFEQQPRGVRPELAQSAGPLQARTSDPRDASLTELDQSRRSSRLGATAASQVGYAAPIDVTAPRPSVADATQSQQKAAAVAELFENAGEAEVVCIIRPLDNPRAASRVVIINRASPKFVADLIGEIQTQTVSTSLHRPSTAQADTPPQTVEKRFRFHRGGRRVASSGIARIPAQPNPAIGSVKPYRRRLR